ncbi:nicotinate-nucleotide--dimethylbenzimidazole phosphoribosyltransferase [Lysobacteraceae bacterium NML95-0200]|nr:nicotinate-nucleotide--dimethylbenzimidazole phosphoribosyltransferase [Xanthomonadaceae bacterium NML95-0200]
MNLEWLHAPVAALDAQMHQRALQHQMQLTKPPGALGRLETLAVTLAAMQRQLKPALENPWIAIFAADHGVAAENISAFPQAVTGQMLANFATGGAAISVLAKHLGARLEVVNLGVVNDPGEIPGVQRVWIAPGTANFCQQPAMSAAQLAAALAAGRDSVQRAKAAGADIFIGGEMGIGNTTAASALACALLALPAEQLAGAGTGLSADGIAHKAEVINRALALHAGQAQPLDWLRCLGGFEIAALAGAYIAAAQAALPVMVDGFISSAAALVAVHIQPKVRDWLLFSHRSKEQGHGRLLQALAAEPLLDLDLRLGEGSGAATALPLLRLACALHGQMATFAEAGVSRA